MKQVLVVSQGEGVDGHLAMVSTSRSEIEAMRRISSMPTLDVLLLCPSAGLDGPALRRIRAFAHRVAPNIKVFELNGSAEGSVQGAQTYS